MIKLSQKYLPATKKIWQVGDSMVITIDVSFLKLLGAKKNDFVKVFMKKVEDEQKDKVTPTAPTAKEEIKNEPENQESRPEVPDMQV